jgi:hypothetical protein
MKNKKLLQIIIITAIIVLFAISIIYFKITAGKTGVVMDKTGYKVDEEGRVKITNSFSEIICFSSCYPFYFEKENNGIWESIAYNSCETEDFAEKCLESRKVKAFKFTFPGLEAGNYRLAIPVCDNCKEGDKFSSSKWIYSNAFIIN